MKLVYIAQTSILDEYAHNVQIMKMCEAFSQNNIEIDLVIPKTRYFSKVNLFELYDVSPTFKIIQLPYIYINHGSSKSIFYWIKSVSFLISSRIYLSFVRYDYLYTRDFYFGLFFKKVFLELHSLPNTKSSLKNYIFRKISGFVVLTTFIKNKLVDLGVDPNRVVVSHDAVRLEDFSNVLSKQEARKNLSLPNDIFLVGYVGTLKTMGMEKGVGTAILSTAFLPDNFILYVVGGEDQDIDFYKKFAQENDLYSRVIFAGRFSHKEVPNKISACDVLVAPFPDMEHYRYYMSPLKIFEYMASKKPIIATDLPSLKEVLKNGENAVLIPTSDHKALADATLMLSQNSDFARKISEKAYNDILNKYTWKIRTKDIISFIKS